MKQIVRQPNLINKLFFDIEELVFLLAGKEGFEPTHNGVKVHCLTTWLLPIVVLIWVKRLFLFQFLVVIVVSLKGKYAKKIIKQVKHTFL